MCAHKELKIIIVISEAEKKVRFFKIFKNRKFAKMVRSAHKFQKSLSPRYSLTRISSLVDFSPVSLFFFSALCKAPRCASFRFSRVSLQFSTVDDAHSGQKDFFQCIELRDVVGVQTKRDYPGDERDIKTKYGSELTIFLVAAFHGFCCLSLSRELAQG